MAPPYTSLAVPVVNPSTYNTGCSGVVGVNANCNSGDQEWTGRSCGGCANGSCAGGNQLNCLRWPGTNPTASQYCPTTYGNPVSATYNGSASQQVICQYDSVTVPASQLQGAFSSSVISQIQQDRCGAQNFTQLYNGTYTNECKTYYGNNYLRELIQRINTFNGGQGRWIGDPTAVSIINNILRNNQASLGLAVQPTDQTAAAQLVAQACQLYPSNSLCGCYNVTHLQHQCAQNSSLPGCSEWVSSNDKLSASGATIEDLSPTNYFCQSSACIDATSSDTALLSEAAITCSTNIAACVTDLSHANVTGSNLSVSCRNAINTGSPSSGGGGGGGDGGSPSPATDLPLPFLGDVLTSSTSQWSAIVVCILLILLIFGVVVLG
jgi:hypothetical protein